MTEQRFLTSLFFLAAAAVCLPILAVKAFYLQAEREANLATDRILAQHFLLAQTTSPGQVLGSSSNQRELYPWTRNGPTVMRRGAWGERGSYIICNGDYCWVFYFAQEEGNGASGQWRWLDQGQPHRLSQSEWWKGKKGKVKPYKGEVFMQYGKKSFDYFWPWTNNGPTAAWASPANILTVCNREICWLYDKNSQQWKNEGEPVRLSQLWQVQPYQGKVYFDNGQEIQVNNFYPWTKGGPTAGWTNAKGIAAICNREICWVYNYNTNQWSGPSRLSASEWWNGSKGKVQDFNGVYPWTNGGPTAGIRWAEDLVAVFNGSVYWLWDVTNSKWVDNGRAYVYREENIQPAQVACLVKDDCDDGNACTKDICYNWRCLNPQKEAGASCGQGKSCNEQGQCVSNGSEEGSGGGSNNNDQCQGKPRVDINCDGRVDLTDFMLWRDFYLEILS